VLNFAIKRNLIFIGHSSCIFLTKQLLRYFIYPRTAIELFSIELNNRFRMRRKTLHSQHVDVIMARLNEDRKTEAKYCDFRIIGDGYNFPIHKSIVGPLSIFFETMFFSKMKEQYENQTNLYGISKKIMENILDFIYTGIVEITSENVYEVMEAANFLSISILKNFCSEFLLEEVKLENCLSLKRFSSLYECHDLSKKVDAVIEQNFEAVISSREFKALGLDEVKSLLELKLKMCYVLENESTNMLYFLKPVLKTFLSENRILKLAEVLRKAGGLSSIDELATIFLSLLKKDAREDWKDCLLSAIADENYCILHNIIQCYFERTESFGWIVQNWELLLTRKNDLISFAQNINFEIHDCKNKFWQSFFRKLPELDDESLSRLADALKLQKQSKSPLSIVSEDRVYDAVFNWIKHDLCARERHIDTIFSSIQIKKISWHHINEVVMKEPLIQKSVECMKLLVQAMAAHSRSNAM